MAAASPFTINGHWCPLIHLFTQAQCRRVLPPKPARHTTGGLRLGRAVGARGVDVIFDAHMERVPFGRHHPFCELRPIAFKKLAAGLLHHVASSPRCRRHGFWHAHYAHKPVAFRANPQCQMTLRQWASDTNDICLRKSSTSRICRASATYPCVPIERYKNRSALSLSTLLMPMPMPLARHRTDAIKILSFSKTPSPRRRPFCTGPQRRGVARSHGAYGSAAVGACEPPQLPWVARSLASHLRWERAVCPEGAFSWGKCRIVASIEPSVQEPIRPLLRDKLSLSHPRAKQGVATLSPALFPRRALRRAGALRQSARVSRWAGYPAVSRGRTLRGLSGCHAVVLPLVGRFRAISGDVWDARDSWRSSIASQSRTSAGTCPQRASTRGATCWQMRGIQSASTNALSFQTQREFLLSI